MSSDVGKPRPGSSASGSEERLDSWKEIAAYLRRSVRSARRWAKQEGLPVRRDVRSEGDSVYAYTEELDDWWINDASPEPASAGRLDSWKEIASKNRLVSGPQRAQRQALGESRRASDPPARPRYQEDAEELARVSGEPRTGDLPAIFE